MGISATRQSASNSRSDDPPNWERELVVTAIACQRLGNFDRPEGARQRPSGKLIDGEHWSPIPTVRRANESDGCH